VFPCDDATISRSALNDALRSNSEFVLTDNSESMGFAERQSIVAYDLRTIVACPLRKRKVQAARPREHSRYRRHHQGRGFWELFISIPVDACCLA